MTSRPTHATAPVRLTAASLDGLRESRRPPGLPDGVEGPAIDPRDLRTGIVHLGIGAFHRAHQAVFTELAAAAAGDHRWGIHGVTQRSPKVRDQLRAQDGLYGVLSLGSSLGSGRTGLAQTGLAQARPASLRLVGSVREISFPGDQTPAVLAAIAAPDTHVVTLTVTEKGYRRDGAGGPDLGDPAVRADLEVLAQEVDGAGSGSGAVSPAAGSGRASGSASAAVAARTAIGLLVRGLARRWRAGGEPLTVVCCDNLMDNGPQVRRLVLALADACGARASSELVTWIEASVRFPCTMVDRIVPATTTEHRAQAQDLLGLYDEGLVVAEPFTQWVIQDDFAGPRPAWEAAGATLTTDVAPYERAKLRVLNAAHSALAYAGALRGFPTVAEAVADPTLYELARGLVDGDVLATLDAPDGVGLAGYRDQVLERFANPAIGHTTVQVAMDGSQKLPIRLLGTVRDRRAAGVVPEAAARVVAAWIGYVRACATGELVVADRTVTLDDPLAGRLLELAAGPVDGVADRLLGVEAVFGADLAGDDDWRRAVRAAVPEFVPSRQVAVR